jgi:hypothetical protein
MAVRPAVPWYWRAAQVLVGALLLLGAGWAALNVLGWNGGSSGDARRELARLRERAEGYDAELATLRARLAHAERRLQIDHAAAADLAKQVKALAFENAALKEDLAFFQSLMPNAARAEGDLTVNRFRLQPEAVAGEYRYQMLLVQTGQRMKEFRGNLQFILHVQQDGRKQVVVVPPEGERNAREYQVNFKFFQRVQGTFKIAPGAVLRDVQVRVFENGARTPKLTQTVNVS